MDVVTNLWEAASSHEIWLPNNVTWEDVQGIPTYPKRRDLLLAFPLAIFLIILRFIFDRWAFQPLADYLRINGGKKGNLQQNIVLQKQLGLKDMKKYQLETLSKKHKWTIQNSENLMRRKRKSASQQKFKASAWRLLFYSLAVILGTAAVWGKSWVTNIADCYPDSFSKQVITEPIRWYYIIQLSFYLSLCISLWSDVNRKAMRSLYGARTNSQIKVFNLRCETDFMVMVLHHLFTITLVVFSWILNLVYVGSIVFLCHDVADIPLEIGKLFKYAKKEKWSLAASCVFVTVWFFSRLGYFPVIIYRSLLHGWLYASTFSYYFLTGAMTGMWVLHLIWTFMIFKFLRTVVRTNKVHDVRSDDESGSEDEEVMKKTK